jgi:hypothetical protein
VTVQLATYLGLLSRSEETLGAAFDTIGQGHSRDAGVYFVCRLLSGQCAEHVAALAPVCDRYGPGSDPERLDVPRVPHAREGELGLLRDLQDLHTLATFVGSTWLVVSQTAQGLRDDELLALAKRCSAQTTGQVKWAQSQLKSIAPQALIIG